MAVWGAPAKLLIRPLRPRAPVTLGIRVPQSKAKRRHGRAAPRGVLHLQEVCACIAVEGGGVNKLTWLVFCVLRSAALKGEGG